jgi:hypothetical protein
MWLNRKRMNMLRIWLQNHLLDKEFDKLAADLNAALADKAVHHVVVFNAQLCIQVLI